MRCLSETFRRNNCCVIQQTVSNRITPAGKKSCVVRIIRLSATIITEERGAKNMSHTDAHDDKKEKRPQYWQLIYQIKVVPGKICLHVSECQKKTKKNTQSEGGSWRTRCWEKHSWGWMMWEKGDLTSTENFWKGAPAGTRLLAMY